MNNNNFRIDSTGFYRNRAGERVVITQQAGAMWVGKYFYFPNGRLMRDEELEDDIIANWEEPQINSDNSKVNANTLERIAELEAALQTIAAYDTWDWKETQLAWKWCKEFTDIAKKALGENA